ncbi:MAG: sigma-70 family RNA polymerase sigma factor [Thermoanaerobaculia bacterium]
MIALVPDPAPSDAGISLVARSLEGDEEAFTEIVRQHQSMVYGIAVHSIHDAALAEELAQEVFLQLYRHLGEIESDEHLVYWLRRVTVNRCIDESRKRRPLLLPLEEVSPVHATEREPDPFLQSNLRNTMATLPLIQRTVVTLRYQEELAPGEIASLLELPLNTVRSHLRRALSSLRRRLENPTGVPS